MKIENILIENTLRNILVKLCIKFQKDVRKYKMLEVCIRSFLGVCNYVGSLQNLNFDLFCGYPYFTKGGQYKIDTVVARKATCCVGSD